MAWGRASEVKPPRSALSKLLPLVILFVVLAGFAFVGYHLYLTFQKISSTTSEKMQSKNVVFTKDGMKVGVKELKTEHYVDRTQGFLVKAWNLSTWPAYKSRLGWNKTADEASSSGVATRKPFSRHSSASN
ncbi:hypothetical protein EG329_009692 [Mollisiaceae sp. DMI_Dod_QoI]|nr:hypothetical protein EG329_009692 [Helotiales sp. DMI_Dod_QoI]